MNEAIKKIKKYIHDNDESCKSKGSYISEAYNGERDYKNDYKGREIFELLQNADDCGDEIYVKFQITRDKDGYMLAVMNSGRAFSAEGVDSLLVSHNSTKDGGKTIGCKGLGFRSILNWTNHIKIVTKEFTASFSEEKAKRKFESFPLEDMYDMYPQLKQMTRTAILSSCFEDDEFETDEIEAEKWLVDKYSTAILLYCDKDFLDDVIKRELDALQFEELLFLNHIAEITVETPNVKRTITSIKEHDPEVHNSQAGNRYVHIVIEENEDGAPERPLSEWYVWADKGKMSDGVTNYEIKLAYNIEAEERKKIRDGGYLYSYFKTGIRMPVPLLVHATLELKSDRSTLVSGNSQNKEVISMLAGFMRETCVEISRLPINIGKPCDYTTLSMMIPNGLDSEGILKEYGFFDDLDRERNKLVRDFDILPSINEEYIGLADCPKYSELSVTIDGKTEYLADIVDKKTFRSLLKRCDDSVVKGYLEANGVSEYSIDELSHLINQNAKEYVDDKRYISLLRLLYENFYEHNAVYTRSDGGEREIAHLILDSDGRLIEESDARIFIGGSDSITNPPKWAHVRIMNSQMREELRPYFGSDGRTMARRLSAFGCREYDWDGVLQELKNQASENAGRTLDLLHWVFDYWENNIRERNIRNLLSSLSGLCVVSTLGEVVKADECYFGDEYGFVREKRITEYIEGVQYVASIKDLGFDNLSTEREKNITIFLHNIGVCELPRFRIVELSWQESQDFLDYVGANTHGKYSTLQAFGSDEEYKCSDVKGWSGLSISVSSVGNSVKDIDNILGKADFYDIVNWLIELSESEERNYITEDVEASRQSQINGIPHNKQNPRTIQHNQIFSWLKYKLATSKWVKIGDNECDFSECTIAANNFYPIIYSLSMIDDDDVEGKTGGKKKYDVVNLFKMLGMPEKIVDLPKQTIYRLLRKLPEKKKAGDKGAEKNVLELYSSLNQTFSDRSSAYNIQDLISDNDERNKFLRDGEILARVDGRYEYMPVQNVYYVDRTASYSDDVLKKCPRISLSRHSGSRKIENLFGVKPMPKVKITLVSFELHCLDSDYKKEFKKQIPFVYATRIKASENSKDLGLSKLNKIEIVLLESAKIEVEYESDDDIVSVDMDNYSFFIQDSKRAYIKIPAEIMSLQDFRNRAKCHSAISEVVSAVMDIETDDKFNLIFSHSPNSNEDFFQMQDDGYYYNLALKEIGDLDPEGEFWESVATVVNDDPNRIKERYGDLLSPDFDYDNLSDSRNIKSIKRLFAELGISVSDFNEYSFSTISFAQYNSALFEKLKVDKKNGYLYWIAMTTSQEADKTILDYNAKQREYDDHKIDVDGLDFDAADEFEKAFGIAPDRLPAEGNGLKEILAELNDRQKTLEKREKGVESNRVGGSGVHSESTFEASGETDYKALMAEIDQKFGVFVDVKYKAPGEKVVPLRNGRGTGSRGGLYNTNANVRKEIDGFIGERVVYNKLKQMEKDGQIKSLHWVSGNAERAGVMPKEMVDDRCGYDISFIDGKDVLHYIDVKTSSAGKIKFSISRNEVDMGMKKSQMDGIAYDIYFVSLGQDLSEYRIHRIYDFFVFADSSEDFFNNNRYSVKNSSFSVTVNMEANNTDVEDGEDDGDEFLFDDEDG